MKALLIVARLLDALLTALGVFFGLVPDPTTKAPLPVPVRRRR
jgi:hypothetical protein